MLSGQRKSCFLMIEKRRRLPAVHSMTFQAIR
jgi:hypothetical protein